MYALRYQAADSPAVLVEVTRGELQAYADTHGGDPYAEPNYPRLQRVDASYARRWVTQDMIHETGLYVGEDHQGRRCVRYAKGESE